MKVDVYQAVLTIEGKKKVLNKAMAKQFPVCSSDARLVDRDDAREPICKIRGEVIGRTGWLYLVEDEVAGLVWELAVTYGEDFGRKLWERGHNVDDPSQVPTVIL